jgi:hypothetical protein
MIVLGAGMVCLLPINPGQRTIIFLFAIVLAAPGGVMLWRTRTPKPENAP